MVEIMTQKTSHPSRDWINMVETSRARNKIRQWFSRERREDERQDGKEALDREMRKRSLPLNKREVSRILAQVSEEYRCGKLEDLHRLIGAGQVPAGQVANKAAQYMGIQRGVLVPEHEAEPREPRVPGDDVRRRIKVHGLENALVTVARCCNPTPGEEIVGFVTRGRGVSVHSKDCPNVQDLSREAERMMDVSWEGMERALRFAEIQVNAMDRPKLVRDITTVLGDQHVNIISATFSIDAHHIASSRYVFEVGSADHLRSIIRELRRIESIYDVVEISSSGESDAG